MIVVVVIVVVVNLKMCVSRSVEKKRKFLLLGTYTKHPYFNMHDLC